MKEKSGTKNSGEDAEIERREGAEREVFEEVDRRDHSQHQDTAFGAKTLIQAQQSEEVLEQLYVNRATNVTGKEFINVFILL